MARTDDDVLRLVVLLLAAFVLLPVLAMALFVPMLGMMGWMGGAPTGVRSTWMLVVPLFWVLVVVGIGYLGYRAVTGRDGRAEPALAELRAAYARGDLTREEYEERRKTLRED